MKFFKTAGRGFSSVSTNLILALLIFSVYLPFLGTRIVRTAGDEKVYVSQAIEMERQGSWFVQTLQDEPNYYKGPLHYLLLRGGMKVFGHTSWAALYMNLILVLLGGIAIANLVKRRYPEWKGGDLWIGTAFSVSVGIYAHVFASQMEIELASLFVIGAWLLDRLKLSDAGWIFWSIVGVIGWIKAPLHSVFMGVSAILYWSFCGELLPRLKNSKTWLAVFFGIVLCFAGYLPAYFLDQENFWKNYVLREVIGKSSGSGQGRDVAIASTFGFYLLPWAGLAFVTYLQTLFQGRELLKYENSKRLMLLGISLFIPSAAFFCWHPYRFENYNLPVIAGVWLWIASVWGSAELRAHSSYKIWNLLRSMAFGLTGILILVLLIALTYSSVHFNPLPFWWPIWLMPVIWLGMGISIAGFFYFGLIEKGKRPGLLAMTSCGLFIALGAVCMVIGEREMVDIRAYLRSNQKEGRKVQLDYYNLNRNIWSEWGYLGFWIDYPVKGLHDPESLKSALLRGDTILVTSKENGIQEFRDFMKKNFPTMQLKETLWKRWRTRGEGANGQSLWLESWQRRDLSILEDNYMIYEPIYEVSSH